MAKKNVSVILSVFLFLFLAADVFAKGNVLAVLSFDNPVYRETLKGFMGSAGLTVTEYVMASDEKDIPAKVTGAKAYDLIFAVGTKAHEAAKKTKLPVVFSMVFVEPSAGGAGVTLAIPAETKVEKMKQFLPGKNKVGVIYSEESSSSFNQFNAAASASGFKVTGKKVAAAAEFSGAFDSVASSSDCYLMLPDTKLYTAQTIKALFTASMAKKIPVVGLSAVYTKAGAVISLDCNYGDIGAQAGEIASEVASGGKGKVAYPRKVTVSLNSAVSSSMGISGMDSKADQVF